MSITRNLKDEIEEMNNSPYLQLLGIKVVELAEGYARLVIAVEERMNSRFGALHGGVLSALADSAVAIALFTMIQPGKKAVTVELNINYFRPVKGKQVVAEANIVHKGNAIAVGDVSIEDEGGSLVAKSRATYMIVT
ncbi:PaaI family thioesterase [Chloroflexota bacterium]